MAIDVTVAGLEELLGILNNLQAGAESAVHVTATIGTAVPYAPFVEFGTAPHRITAVNARALRFDVGGQTVFARSVQHPGTKPTPFMETALDASAATVTTLVNDALGAIAAGGPVSLVEEAVQIAADVVAEAAKAAAPSRTGALRDSIVARYTGAP